MSERALPAEVTGSLRALSTEIDRLDQAAADRYGLNRTDMRALDILGRAGPLAPTALARLLGFTTGGVTTVLDRLEKAGYIRRRPDPGDRRRQLVETTQATAARDEEVSETSSAAPGTSSPATPATSSWRSVTSSTASGNSPPPTPTPSPAAPDPDQAMPRPPAAAGASGSTANDSPSSATAAPASCARR